MLIFQSDRAGGIGADDFWITTRASRSSPWSDAIHLSPEINTADDEIKAEFAADGRTLLFVSNRPGGIGSLDIWQVPLGE